MNRMLLGVAVLSLVFAPSSIADDVREVEVAANFVIDTQGEATDVTLLTALHPVVRDIVRQEIGNWRFQPVIEDGETRRLVAHTKMRLTAEAVDDGMILRIADVSFSEPVVPVRAPTPVYPKDALMREVDAVVDMRFRVDADGRVTDAHAYRTGLHGQRLGPSVQRALRRDFERASLEVVRRWRFDPRTVTPGETMGYRITYQTGELRHGDDYWNAAEFGEAAPAPWEPGGTDSATVDDGGRGLVASQRVVPLDEVIGKTL